MSRTIAANSGRAWVATVAAALANGTAFGTAYTFGTFFRSMTTEFGSTRGATAVIFGITLLFFFGFGLFTGPLSDRVPAHRLLAVGATVFVTGLLLTSRVHQLAFGYVAYGAGVGLGSGCFIAPLTALVGRLHTTRRTLAIGIVAAGNGLGTLVLVPVAARLIDRHGWRTAYVMLAAIGAVVFTAAWFAVRDRAVDSAGDSGRTTAARSFDPRPSLALLGERYFGALFVSTLLMAIGLYVAFAYVVPFAEDDGLRHAAAARLMALVGLASIVGRLFLTGVTARLGPLRAFRGALALQTVAYGVWFVAGGRAAVLVVFVLLLGVGYGGFVAIGPEMIMSRYGTGALGARMGVQFLAFGVGGLVGPALAGVVADATNGHGVPIALVILVLVAALVASVPMGTRPRTRSA